MSARGPHGVVVHAHFYQPPREDPWLDEVEREAGAAPFHDWNERIERECYRAVVAARLTDARGRIRGIANTLEWISYNVGPTLMEWLERQAPETYLRILEADRLSLARTGHGNALAMPYHHTILPLASRRDKLTEVRWGIADFRRRFGRDPEGMWLPETALDDEALDVLAEAGIGFTLVAPAQVVEAPPRGQPGRYTTAHGRTIALVVYDGPISHDVAFGPLIRSGDAWAEAIAGRHPGDAEPVLTAVATDGETYGHHHAYGEMALAAMIAGAALRGLELVNPAAWLARYPAPHPVRIVAPSSWSCAHGVERWRADCGCRLEPARFPSQAWRRPLREALDWLAGELHAVFEQEAQPLVGDPWAARDALDGRPPSEVLLPAARRLLEMERNALRMFTSCGWFFDDLAGIETRQCLRYAVRAIELAGPHRDRLLEGLATRLSAARENGPRQRSGDRLLLEEIVPALPAAARVAAAQVAADLFPWAASGVTAEAWRVEADEDGALRVTDRRTGEVHAGDGLVRRDAEGRLMLRVRLDDQPAEWTVRLPDLPESTRRTLRAAMTGAIFPTELAAPLFELGVPLREAVRGRLLELLPEDLDLPSVEPALLHGALDLLDLEGEPLPFDVQTRFWFLMAQGSPAVRQVLEPFRARFGLAPDHPPPA